jgi:hypothetical protein
VGREAGKYTTVNWLSALYYIYICLYLVIHRTNPSREIARCCVLPPWELQCRCYSLVGLFGSSCQTEGDVHHLQLLNMTVL